MKPLLKHFIGLSSFEMLAMFRRGLFYAYLSIYLRHYLGLSVTETTLFATLPMVLNIVSQTFIWGRISDRLQMRRTLIIIGEILAAIGTLTLWYAHRLPFTPKAAGYTIIIGLTIIEIFWSMSNIAWSALVSDIYDADQRSSVQGRLASMGGIGRMLGVWIGGLLYDGLALQYPGWGFYEGPLFFISAGVMMISTLPLFFLPEGGLHQSQKNNLSDTNSIDKTPTSITIYVIFLLAMSFVNFGRNSITIILPQYLSLENGLAIDSRMLANIINMQSVAIILFGWTAGWFSTKMGNAKALILGIATAISALCLLIWSTELILLYLSNFLRGMADAIIMASAYTYASLLIAPQKRARGFAWFNATFFLSWGMASTFIAGPIVDLSIRSGYSQSRAYQLSFAAAAGITLIGLVIFAGLMLYRGSKKKIPLNGN